MSAHHDSSVAPTLPEIHDEAADSPLWLPIVGAVLLALALTFAMVLRAMPDEPAASPTATEAPAH